MSTDPATINSLFTSASLMVAFFGGMAMLFAPCCITLMLPAYLGSVFRAKSRVLLMTLIFALGVASIMLPLVLGARFLASFFSNYHFFVFAGGSLLMLGVGFMSLFNKTVALPFVSRLQSPRVTTLASAYVLGVVSGISSTCCAPVLLGALTLSALSPSMVQAAGVGFAYTFGIVFPLFILSLFYERGYEKWGFRLQQKTIRFGSFSVALSNFVSFVIFTVTGIVFLVLAMTNRIQMGEGVIEIAITLKSWVNKITEPIRAIPYGETIFGILLFLIFIYFIRSALRKKQGAHEEG